MKSQKVVNLFSIGRVRSTNNPSTSAQKFPCITSKHYRYGFDKTRRNCLNHGVIIIAVYKSHMNVHCTWHGLKKGIKYVFAILKTVTFSSD